MTSKIEFNSSTFLAGSVLHLNNIFLLFSLLTVFSVFVAKVVFDSDRKRVVSSKRTLSLCLLLILQLRALSKFFTVCHWGQLDFFIRENSRIWFRDASRLRVSLFDIASMLNAKCEQDQQRTLCICLPFVCRIDFWLKELFDDIQFTFFFENRGTSSTAFEYFDSRESWEMSPWTIVGTYLSHNWFKLTDET